MLWDYRVVLCHPTARTVRHSLVIFVPRCGLRNDKKWCLYSTLVPLTQYKRPRLLPCRAYGISTPFFPSKIPRMRHQSCTERVIQRKLRCSGKELRHSLCSRSASLLPMYISHQRRSLVVEFMKIMGGNVAISSMILNPNTYSHSRCLHDFRFRLKEILQISEATACNAGRTARSG